MRERSLSFDDKKIEKMTFTKKGKIYLMYI